MIHIVNLDYVRQMMQNLSIKNLMIILKIKIMKHEADIQLREQYLQKDLTEPSKINLRNPV